MSRLMRRQRGNRQKDLVGFRIGDVSYALDIHRVREILNPLPVVTLPQSPAAVLGVADHRGEVVPIVDLRSRFDLPPNPGPRRTKWIIVDRDGAGVGLVVDEVTDVFGAASNDRRAVPSISQADRRGIIAVYSYDSMLVFVLDPEILTDVTAALDLPDSLEGAS
ncbi:MAG: chemotaxis protein CheW [Sandaracinus sp.]|nr:chemotaxis protein CheW [Sandaracinus sp.]